MIIKVYSVWMPFRGDPPERGKPTTAFCSSACAGKAGKPSERVRWAAVSPDDRGVCSECGRALNEVPESVLKRDAEREAERMARGGRKRKE